ncbi:MAG: ABC transporter permease [Ruminococcaceae bacterium]|nr:ABC transporter permease [Oscillospiraceae bacterium]
MKKSGILSKIFIGLVFLFLYAPIAVLIVFSFNASKSRTVWAGFTLDWYVELFSDSAVMEAFGTTILVSVLAAIIATVLGTVTAVGLNQMGKRSRNFLLGVNNIPVMNSEIITGVSLMLLFLTIGNVLRTRLGFGTLLLSHITFDTPYVILSVMPKLRQMDKNMFEAAQDLGATKIQSFFKVVLPQIRSGVVNGMLIAFTLSLDDFVISYFTSGTDVQTLSMLIYSMTRKRISPKINALSTILFVAVLALLVIVNVRQFRQEKAQAKKEAALDPDIPDIEPEEI